MNKIIRFILAFTWELPQSIMAAIAILCLKEVKILNCDDNHFSFSFESEILSSFSLGEFIFYNSHHTTENWWMDVRRHESGHSIQSRILGPLYLLLIGVPSLIWNFMSQKSEFCAKHYYDTPWEHWANILAGIK